MSRPRKVIADPKKRKAHEAHLARRKARHAAVIADRNAVAAAEDAAESESDFEAIVSAEKARTQTQSQKGGSARSAPKTLTAARENLTMAFDLMGGVPALVAWGRKNQTEFYRLWARLIPKESVEISAQLPLEELLAKLSGQGAGMSVAEAAYQVGADLLSKGRDQALKEDREAPGPDDRIN